MAEVTPEALAGEWAAQADTWEHSGLNVRDLRKRIAQVRELAPAHAALADERNTLAADKARLAAEVTSLKGVTEALGRDVHRIAGERDKARERQAETDREVSAALKTAARWQGENQRLIEERDDLAAQAATLKGEPPLTEADLIAHALAAEEGHANGTAHDAFGCRPCLLQARARLAALERDWNTARDLQLRYQAALEAIAECRAGMPYPVLARKVLEGDHA